MIIQVQYEVFSTRYHIDKALKRLEQYATLGFDTETKGVYSKAERKAAEKYLLQQDLPLTEKRVALLVAGNSGLSFPSLVNVTHFVFGISEDQSIVIVCEDHQTEMYIWCWLVTFTGKLIIHNTLFDLKLMYHRVRVLPKDYEDSALYVKAYINNAEEWRARIGLKDLVGEYYPPWWSLYNEYEPDNLRDPKFLEYTAIDGAANMKLWSLIQEQDDA
jgi:hypothetical protein